MFMDETTWTAVIKRSYEVRDAVPARQRVVCTTTHDTYFRGEIPAGSEVQVVDYTNAGFRGIEAGVRVIGQLDESGRGWRYAVINAGLLKW
jgi:hypothetical protein